MRAHKWMAKIKSMRSCKVGYNLGFVRLCFDQGNTRRGPEAKRPFDTCTTPHYAGAPVGLQSMRPKELLGMYMAVDDSTRLNAL